MKILVMSGVSRSMTSSMEGYKKQNPMYQKKQLKLAVDIAMTLSLLLLMGYQFWGDVLHELAGTAMFLLMIAHHFLNAGWYVHLFKGKYTYVRVLQLLVNTMLLAAMLGLMISGIILSRHVFSFLPIEGGMSFARRLICFCEHNLYFWISMNQSSGFIWITLQ
ncbi:hypothetical protein GCM10008910_26890 [Faecalicatena orotica]|uniref:DUF4405 domain-containing protein n=1 Tax=Faecalicatena orotica TaxID=1544 RepID=UPI0031E426A7